jgi:hypothetical protein
LTVNAIRRGQAGDNADGRQDKVALRHSVFLEKYLDEKEGSGRRVNDFPPPWAAAPTKRSDLLLKRPARTHVGARNAGRLQREETTRLDSWT